MVGMTTTRRESTGNQGVIGLHPLRRSVYHEIRGIVETLRHERLSSPTWEPTGVSHRAGAPVQPGTVSASGPARGPVWGGSRRRTRTDTRVVPQSANSHLGRLSLSGDALHHIIRWNVAFLKSPINSFFLVSTETTGCPRC